MDEWWRDQDNQHMLARELIRKGELATPEEVLYFFEKPWKYDPEWTEYERAWQ